ncbi:hypothetical protein PM082_020028 [Marasmius tenuissimus]|nr:hypothetical protein PM082_020028 [Marasmius tenuissimus]
MSLFKGSTSKQMSMTSAVVASFLYPAAVSSCLSCFLYIHQHQHSSTCVIASPAFFVGNCPSTLVLFVDLAYPVTTDTPVLKIRNVHNTVIDFNSFNSFRFSTPHYLKTTFDVTGTRTSVGSDKPERRQI